MFVSSLLLFVVVVVIVVVVVVVVVVHGAARVNKRWRENGEDLENRKTGGRGPRALKRAYRDLA